MAQNEKAGAKTNAAHTEFGKHRIALNSLRRETLDACKDNLNIAEAGISKENTADSDIPLNNAGECSPATDDKPIDFPEKIEDEKSDDNDFFKKINNIANIEKLKNDFTDDSAIDFSELDKKTQPELSQNILKQKEKSQNKIQDKKLSEIYRAERTRYNANVSRAESKTNNVVSEPVNPDNTEKATTITESNTSANNSLRAKKAVSAKKGLQWLEEETKRSEAKVYDNIDLIFGSEEKIPIIENKKQPEQQINRTVIENHKVGATEKSVISSSDKLSDVTAKQGCKKAAAVGKVLKEPPDATALYDTSKAFADSVKTLKSNDIPLSAPQKSKMSALFTRNNIKKIFLVFFIIVFIASAGQLVYIVIDHIKAEQMYSDIDKELNQSDSDEAYTLRQDKKSTEMLSLESAQFAEIDDTYVSDNDDSYNYVTKLKGKVNYYHERNSDVCGYIIVPNTRIDYPVLYSGDNEFYLNHDFLGNFRLAGAIFMDYRNSKDFTSNYNTCIYGHNLAGGTMFNNITLFLDANFFAENKYIELINSTGLYTYEVFAAYKTDMYDNYIQTDFSSGEEFVEFAYEMKSRSYNEREGIEFTSDDRILTLSTCTNVVQEERYTIQAKLVKVQ